MPFWLAVVTRVHGGWGNFSYGRTITTLLFGLPFVLLSVHVGYSLVMALIVASFAMIGLSLGVIDGFPGQMRDSPISPVSLAIAKIFNVQRGSSTYNAIYLMIRALIMVLAASFKSPLLLIAVPLWALMYWISFKVSKHSEYAEVLTGSILGDLILLSW